MKILVCHNYYQQRGGEDQVFADEAALFEAHGHDVLRYTVHNDAIGEMGRLEVARRTIWNSHTYRELRELIRRERPVLMHCTNTFPLISPAAYYAAHREGVAVVQTLQNYRLLCPKAQFLRDGRVCEDCFGKLFAWSSLKHNCYRDSKAATGVLAGMLTIHKLLGTWGRKVDRYIVATEFARQKFIAANFRAEQIAVKPNFVSPDLGAGPGRGDYVAFVGRLSPEKGIDTLLAAWSANANLPHLKIVGDGPMAEQVRAAAATNPAIEWLGSRPVEEVLEIVGNAAMLVFPSVWYEGLPKTMVESFCRGTPVVASRLGAMAGMIEHGRTGLLFEPGNANALATAVADLYADRQQLEEMRREVRAEFEATYTAERNYEQLARIYAAALRARGNLAAAEEMLATIPPANAPLQAEPTATLSMQL